MLKESKTSYKKANELINRCYTPQLRSYEVKCKVQVA